MKRELLLYGKYKIVPFTAENIKKTNKSRKYFKKV